MSIATPETQTQSTTETDETFRALTGHEEQLDDGSEKDRFSHYVKHDDIVAAAVDGTPAVALCGKVWVPNASPEKYPVCPTCKAIYEGIPAGEQ